MKLPPLTALKAFEGAARNGSFSAAARELNVTHAAIAQQVRKLEDWFGLPLIRRAGRGVETTAQGAILAAGLGDGFAAIKNAVDALSEDYAKRPLKITLTPTFAANWLMPRIGGFRAEHPDIEIMINPTAQPLDLIAGDYDAGFRFGAGQWQGLEAEKILDGGYSVFAARSIIEKYKVKTPADVAALPWVQELCMNDRAVWLKTHGVEDNGIRNVLHMPGDLMIDAIRRGEGVGITGRIWFEKEVEEGSIVSLFYDEATADLSYWIVRRPGPSRPPLRTFLNWVRTEIAM